uniref:Uncharacterized protein n=1 Tax=Naja naja TaxID=35670 RepID=A0A8C6Y741_NAJNA
MTSLDTQTDFYVGGPPSLNLVNPRAIKNVPTGFTGCIREVFVNGKELKLTEKGAKSGSNIGDCDGTPCGYRVCKNNGKCKVIESDYSCLCPKQWMGKTCDVCIPNPFTGNSYIKYTDTNYEERDLRFTRISFNFTTSQMDGLLWLFKNKVNFSYTYYIFLISTYCITHFY